MKPYETLFFTEPEISEETAQAVISKIEGAISRFGGEVEKISRWGKRPLATKVEKFTEGYYVLIEFKGTPEVLKELERFYLINQNILRFITIARPQ